jgi:DNA replication protein DnaC
MYLVNRSLNVIVTGATGTGKTFLACRHSYTVRYYHVFRLLTNLTIARGDGSFNRLMNELNKVRQLILDDWGINPFGSVEGRDLLEVIEDRCQHNSTLAISQIPVGDWHQLFDDPTVADAVMDRLIHDAYLIGLKGESMRKLKTKLKNDENSKGPIDSN